MGYSAASPKFEPPTKSARGFLAIFVLTTDRRTSSAISIRGSSEYSQSTTRKLNATLRFGVRWNPSLVRNCLRSEGASRLLPCEYDVAIQDDRSQSSTPSGRGATFGAFSAEQF